MIYTEINFFSNLNNDLKSLYWKEDWELSLHEVPWLSLCMRLRDFKCFFGNKIRKMPIWSLITLKLATSPFSMDWSKDPILLTIYRSCFYPICLFLGLDLVLLPTVLAPLQIKFVKCWLSGSTGSKSTNSKWGQIFSSIFNRFIILQIGFQSPSFNLSLYS